MKLFNKWVDTPTERFLAVMILIFLPIGVLSVGSVCLADFLQLSERMTEILKCVGFLSLGLVCLATGLAHIIDYSSPAKFTVIRKELKIVITRGYTWSIVSLLVLIVVANLNQFGILNGDNITSVGKLTLVITVGFAIAGFIQNRKKKISYVFFPKTLKNILLPLTIAAVFILVGIYLCLNLLVS